MGIIISVIHYVKVIPFTGIITEPDIVDTEFFAAAVLEEHQKRKPGCKGRFRLKPDQMRSEMLITIPDINLAILVA